MLDQNEVLFLPLYVVREHKRLDMKEIHIRDIHVDQATTKQDLAFCESVEKAHTSQSDSAKIADLLGITKEPVRIDSQCKYAVVARGDASIYLRLPTRRYQEKFGIMVQGSW